MTAGQRVVVNDLTDRQWAAAYVVDQSPIVFDPLVEARRWRDEVAVEIARDAVNQLESNTTQFEALDQVVADLLDITTIREQRALLTRIARGEA